MQFQTIVSLKHYVIATLLSTAISAAFCNGYEEYIGLGLVYMGTVVNHIFLVELVWLLSENAKDNGQKTKHNKKKIVFYAIGKLAVLILALSFGVHFMGKRVIIAVLNYVLQIFILGLCTNKARGLA